MFVLQWLLETLKQIVVVLLCPKVVHSQQIGLLCYIGLSYLNFSISESLCGVTL